jgi:hypothetical protein
MGMLVHFNADETVACDSCGQSRTIVNMQAGCSDNCMRLCIVCYRSLFVALSQASKKLIS